MHELSLMCIYILYKTIVPLWRRKWQPTPVFLPGESQRQGSLVGGHLWGRTESDTTEVTYQQHSTIVERLEANKQFNGTETDVNKF